MKVTFGPPWHLQSPALGEMLTGGTNPSINHRITDGLRNCIEALLLSGLIGIIEVELIDKFIERTRKFQQISSRNLRNLGEGLRAS